MGPVLTHAERIRLWSALSDVFVDNDVDHAAIARQLAGFERATLEAAFFAEVAPVCYSNLQAPIPPIWTAFDSAWLAETIERSLEARRSSSWRRLRDQAWTAYLRYRLRDEWRSIAHELDRQAAAP